MPPAAVATGFATSLLLVALPALMPAPQAVAAQGPLDTGAWPERLSALESELDEPLDAGAIPGLSIAVVADDQVWTREAGVLRRGASEAIAHETLFEAASLGKPVFAHLVLRLVERGLLDLDAPLSEYWHYADLDGEARLDEITARIVLSHRTGLPTGGATVHSRSNWSQEADFSIPAKATSSFSGSSRRLRASNARA